MWYIYEKRKMKCILLYVILSIYPALSKHAETTDSSLLKEENLENNIVDFDDDYSVKFKDKYDKAPWHSSNFKKESHRYTIIKDNVDLNKEKASELAKTKEKKHEKIVASDIDIKRSEKPEDIVKETTPVSDFSVLPAELISTTENPLLSIIDSTTEADLSVIPLTIKQSVPILEIKQTVILPSTPSWVTSTEYFTTENVNKDNATSENNETTTTKREVTTRNIVETTTVAKGLEKTVDAIEIDQNVNKSISMNITEVKLGLSTQIMNRDNKETTAKSNLTDIKTTTEKVVANTTEEVLTTTKIIETVFLHSKNLTENVPNKNKTNTKEVLEKIGNVKKEQNITDTKSNFETEVKRETNETKPTGKNNQTELNKSLKVDSSERRNGSESLESDEEDVPVFTELDTEDLVEVPEDYYDSKDVLPTTAPKTDAISVIFGLAGSVVESVVESVAERVVPKGIYDLFKRMQKQSEALEAERLRSREENGGLGQFTRGIIKSISDGLSKPLSQLMAGVKDIGSLDTDRGFVSSVTSSLATGVTSVANVANSLSDAFKDKVQAIYPGTLWCGDGHSATARSGDLGLFFFTDTCCRQHDACKIYISAGDTKYGLTNTGLFTRSHCSCDAQFRECLRKTNSLVSAQIGITYFNVLGPQCFRKAHPIVKCVRRTRITGQKCEEYELDYTKPKMWQWFDNETY